MEETFYNIEELTAITGLSKDHLTDTDGPIARVCRAFPETNLGDRRQGLNYDGLQKLNEYLEALEEGIGYEEWAKQANKPEVDGGIIVVPSLETELIGVDDQLAGAMSRLDNLHNQFGKTSQGYTDYYSDLGTFVGRNAAAKFSHAVADAIEEGIKATYEKLKLT